MADMKKNMNKTTRSNFITYGIVIVLFAVVQILSSTGNLSRLLTGLLVPHPGILCGSGILPQNGGRRL